MGSKLSCETHLLCFIVSNVFLDSLGKKPQNPGAHEICLMHVLCAQRDTFHGRDHGSQPDRGHQWEQGAVKWMKGNVRSSLVLVCCIGLYLVQWSVAQRWKRGKEQQGTETRVCSTMRILMFLKASIWLK